MVAPADVAPEALREYFDSLFSTVDNDYLRIPILTHIQGKTNDGRPQLTMTIATDGTSGVHGKPFSSSSRVYAVTLAASQLNDRDDIFMARHHYEEADQLSKPETGTVMLTLDLI
jgi:hypothetical protein